MVSRPLKRRVTALCLVPLLSFLTLFVPLAPYSAVTATAGTIGLPLLAKRLLPTVVYISVRSLDTTSQATFTKDVVRVKERVGSGVIVDPAGYVLTNLHVVERAYLIRVTLSDGRIFEAKELAHSPNGDVAYLKIEGRGPFPAARLSRKSHLGIGQPVFALGNPEGLGISMSAGIISALNRNLPGSDYTDFIQTDAAINPGNSGGPLFDERGQVVGINTALYTTVRGGGSQGLGFAIPATDLKFVLGQVLKFGRVRSGWIGAKSQNMTFAMTDAVGAKVSEGVIIADIAPASPSEKSGLQLGDVVRSVDGHPIHDVTELNRLIGRSEGRLVKVGLARSGVEKIINVPVVEEPGSAFHNDLSLNTANPHFVTSKELGIKLDSDAQFGESAGNGAHVKSVERESIAELAGLNPNDVIMVVQGQQIGSQADLDTVLLGCEVKQLRHVLVLIWNASKGKHWIALPIRPIQSSEGRNRPERTLN